MRRVAAVDRTAASAQECSCGNSTAVDGFFEADPSTGRLVFTTGSVDDSIREAVTRLAKTGPFGFALLSGDGPPRIVGQWADAVPGVAKGVVGFVAPAAILQPIFEKLVRNERLLPGLLIEPAQNLEYLTIDFRVKAYVSAARAASRRTDPSGGFAKLEDAARAQGARVINETDVAFGPTPDIYALVRETVHRNLYRIPLR